MYLARLLKREKKIFVGVTLENTKCGRDVTMKRKRDDIFALQHSQSKRL